MKLPVFTIFIRMVNKVGVSAQMSDGWFSPPVYPVECRWLSYPSYIWYGNTPSEDVTRGEEWPITIAPGGIIEAL